MQKLLWKFFKNCANTKKNKFDEIKSQDIKELCKCDRIKKFKKLSKVSRKRQKNRNQRKIPEQTQHYDKEGIVMCVCVSINEWYLPWTYKVIEQMQYLHKNRQCIILSRVVYVCVYFWRVKEQCNYESYNNNHLLITALPASYISSAFI